MVDGSKLLSNAGTVDRDLHNTLDLPGSYRTHEQIHELATKLSSQFSSDLNSDFASLFNEKKYKELSTMALQAQEKASQDAISAFSPLVNALI